MAKDSSGRGNDLPLVSPPLRQDVTIKQVIGDACVSPPEGYMHVVDHRRRWLHARTLSWAGKVPPIFYLAWPRQTPGHALV